MARRSLTGLALIGVSLMLTGAALAQTMSPGPSSGLPGSGTGPTNPPPVPAQAGSGTPAAPGGPGIGTSQVPPGMNPPAPGTSTAPGTVAPGTTQAPPGTTPPRPGTQLTPGTIAPGTPIPQASTPGTPPTGSSPLPSVGTAVTTQQVRSAQQALQGSGVDPGPIDGVMGPRTQQAVRDYQKKQNLPQTGQLDAATLQKLGVSSM
jgi:putative peptidoglycan binding protein